MDKLKLPEVGTHVRVEWVDSAEAPGWSYSQTEPKLWPRLITSRGTVVGRTPLGLVLSAHISEASEDGEKGYLGLLAVPHGCILKCEVLK